ncbi:hypothetical protein JSO61_009295 [Riemerella anatipestifer]|uniref:hypothetical protein n=1 Tax=Riemerella anatipestifer TaxID=34085 RepID=UPI0030C3BD06
MLDYIQISLQLILVLITLYLALFKSYFQEKGKNIATKEDIEEITQKVEKIKNDLNYSTQTKISLKSEEKKTLIEYYEKYYQFQNYLYDISLVGINEENSEKIREIEEKIDHLKSDFDIVSAKLELLINNKDFINKTRDLKLHTLECQSLITEYIGNVEKLFIKVKYILNSNSKENQKEEITKIYEQRSNLCKELNTKKLELYKVYYEKEREVREEIYKTLQKLIEV